MTAITDRGHSTRYPTPEEVRYIASRLTIRALERYMADEATDFLRSQVSAWRLGLDEFDLRDATADLRAALEGMAQAVQNREDRLKSEGKVVVPFKPQ